MSDRDRVIDNIKRSSRISITLNSLWEDIRQGVRDKDTVMEAISQLLDEKRRPDGRR